jgi:hypothetical protein
MLREREKDRKTKSERVGGVEREKRVGERDE